MMMLSARLARVADRLRATPVVAILRGLPLEDVVEVANALVRAGVTVAEVPLNGPQPFEVIARLVAETRGRLMIGAGTVLTPDDVRRVDAAGGEFCVSPNHDPRVVKAAAASGLVMMPGCRTPSEVFAAIASGVTWVKLFPAVGAEREVSALRAVLPQHVRLVGVGGVSSSNAAAMLTAGCAAVGVGSEIYRPAMEIARVETRARAVIAAVRADAAPRVTIAARCDAEVGEGPIALEDRLIWIDPVSQRLFVLENGAGDLRVVPLERRLWSLARNGPEGIVGTCDDALASVNIDTGAVRCGSDAGLPAGCRLNDMTIDGAGGVWAGSMHRGLLAGRGAIYHATSLDAPLRRVADGLGVANGMAFGDDGRVLYVIDTLARTLLVYPAGTGELGDPRIVTDFAGIPGKPDGMIVASDGNLWVAMWNGGCIVEFSPAGAALQRIDIPARHVSSLCRWRDGLFVTTSRMRLSPDQLASSPLSGCAFMVVP